MDQRAVHTSGWNDEAAAFGLRASLVLPAEKLCPASGFTRTCHFVSVLFAPALCLMLDAYFMSCCMVKCSSKPLACKTSYTITTSKVSYDQHEGCCMRCITNSYSTLPSSHLAGRCWAHCFGCYSTMIMGHVANLVRHLARGYNMANINLKFLLLCENRTVYGSQCE